MHAVDPRRHSSSPPRGLQARAAVHPDTRQCQPREPLDGGGGPVIARVNHTSGAADVTTCLDNECESGMIRDDAHGSDNPMLLFMNSRRSSRSDSTPIVA